MTTAGLKSGLVLALIPAALMARPLVDGPGERGGGDETDTAATSITRYYPGPGKDWQRRRPEELGMDPTLVARAIGLSQENPTSIPKQPELAIQQWRAGNEDTHREIIGPVRDHGDVSGMIVKNGYIVAEWGDTERVDMSYSVTKSFVTITTGLALDHGLLRDVHDPVHLYVRGQDGFDDFSSDHNRKITWDHMLRMISEWEGEIWGKPWHAEGRRPAGTPLQEPGTLYVYSNVASARLALAAMQVWRRPLPQVLNEYVMTPIGASTTWRWQGYDNAWVSIDGQQLQGSSSGGGWGASMWISARDLARFGLFTMSQGQWNDRQLLSREWFELAETPTELRDTYGFMNWRLNTNNQLVANAPESAFFHSGSGNRVYVDRENELVVVIRWMELDVFEELIHTILDSLPS